MTTSSTFSLFGFPEMSASEAADRVASLLGITFELHDSSYHGGDYYLWKNGQRGKIAVQENFWDEDGYLTEGDFPETRTIAYASYLEIADLEPLMADDRCILLRTETLQRNTPPL